MHAETKRRLLMDWWFVAAERFDAREGKQTGGQVTKGDADIDLSRAVNIPTSSEWRVPPSFQS
jgi:hypothetical protein